MHPHGIQLFTRSMMGFEIGLLTVGPSAGCTRGQVWKCLALTMTLLLLLFLSLFLSLSLRLCLAMLLLCLISASGLVYATYLLTNTVHVLIPGLLLCVDDKPIASQWDCVTDVLQGTMVWTLTNLQMGSPFQAIFQDDINTSSGDSECKLSLVFHLHLLVIILIDESRNKNKRSLHWQLRAVLGSPGNWSAQCEI